jgi:hypothetical protein
MGHGRSQSRSTHAARCGLYPCLLVLSLVVSILVIGPCTGYRAYAHSGGERSWSVWAIEDPHTAVVQETAPPLGVLAFLFLLLAVHIAPAILSHEVANPENRGPPSRFA